MVDDGTGRSARRAEPGDPLNAHEPRSLGPYVLISRLGVGGMGTVYLARNAEGRRVAVKVIRPDLAADEEFRRRFRAEVEAARRVAPFCTAEVLDADPNAPAPYLVTEYIDGVRLDQKVDEGPLTSSTLTGLAVGVATALTAIHSAGLVHRDLKPSNVMLSLSGPRVIDFGIAQALEGAKARPTAWGFGSAGWMAPEQVHGHPIGPEADVFAWGILIAYAGTGRHPFGEGSDLDLGMRIVGGPPDLRGLPEPLVGLVSASLAKHPDDRPSARELLLRLIAQPPAREDDPSGPVIGQVEELLNRTGEVPRRTPARAGPAPAAPARRQPWDGAPPGQPRPAPVAARPPLAPQPAARQPAAPPPGARPAAGPAPRAAPPHGTPYPPPRAPAGPLPPGGPAAAPGPGYAPRSMPPRAAGGPRPGGPLPNGAMPVGPPSGGPMPLGQSAAGPALTGRMAPPGLPPRPAPGSGPMGTGPYPSYAPPLTTARRGPDRRQLTVIVGVVLAAIIAVVVAVSLPIGQGGDPKAGNPTGQPATSVPSVAPSATPPTTSGFNVPVTDNGLRFVVRGIDCASRELGGGIVTRHASGKYCQARISVTNIGTTSTSLRNDAQVLYDSGGARHTADYLARFQLSEDLWDSLDPGDTKSGTLVFDVPRDVGPRLLELHADEDSRGVQVRTG